MKSAVLERYNEHRVFCKTVVVIQDYWATSRTVDSLRERETEMYEEYRNDR